VEIGFIVVFCAAFQNKTLHNNLKKVCRSSIMHCKRTIITILMVILGIVVGTVLALVEVRDSVFTAADPAGERILPGTSLPGAGRRWDSMVGYSQQQQRAVEI
jgi:hypothetical protein